MRVGCRGERNGPHLSGAAYASPFPDKAPLPEKIALHVEPVEPAHVLRGAGAVKDDRVNHGPIMHLIYAAKKPRKIRAVFLAQNSRIMHQAWGLPLHTLPVPQ